MPRIACWRIHGINAGSQHAACPRIRLAISNPVTGRFVSSAVQVAIARQYVGVPCHAAIALIVPVSVVELMFEVVAANWKLVLLGFFTMKEPFSVVCDMPVITTFCPAVSELATVMVATLDVNDTPQPEQLSVLAVCVSTTFCPAV